MSKDHIPDIGKKVNMSEESKLPHRIVLPQWALYWAFVWACFEVSKAIAKGFAEQGGRTPAQQILDKFYGICAEAAVWIYLGIPVFYWRHNPEGYGKPDGCGVHVRCAIKQWNRLAVYIGGRKPDIKGFAYVFVRRVEGLGEGVYDIVGVLWGGAKEAEDLRDQGKAIRGKKTTIRHETWYIPDKLLATNFPNTYRGKGWENVPHVATEDRAFYRSTCAVPDISMLVPNGEDPFKECIGTEISHALGEGGAVQERLYGVSWEIYPQGFAKWLEPYRAVRYPHGLGVQKQATGS